MSTMVDRWEKKESQPLHDYGFFRLRKDRYLHPDLEGERDFLVIEARDWVNVVAVTPDNQIVLIRQFRYGVGGARWEVPAGVIEPGESPIDAAVRELREETGYAGDPPELICEVEPNPAIQSNLCTSYLIRNATLQHDTEWDDNEVIEVILRSKADVARMIAAGEFLHALLQLPLLHYLTNFRSRSASAGSD
ncbi:MAG: NUDIX hydrolase [Planctomycetes bacterium]|nr:NUDIX hydrolase [Planctomycetota bacterium]